VLSGRAQERQEAEQLFAAGDGLAAVADRTFEPGEGLPEAEPEEEAEAAAEAAEMDATPEPSARKGPTPAEITAIKVRTSSCAWVLGLPCCMHVFPMKAVCMLEVAC
jgi:hypothetical protein